MAARYTPRQGQYLAFIHTYEKLHRRPPAETDLERYFQVSPPAVHDMILRLEERGLISRVPGEARTIRVLVPPEELPPLGEVTPRASPGAPALAPIRLPAAPRRRGARNLLGAKQMVLLGSLLGPNALDLVEERQEESAGQPHEVRTAPMLGGRRRRAAKGKTKPEAFGSTWAYAFRVVLKWNREVWRIIEVRGDQTLDDLHLAIQQAFGWDNDHMYSFFLSGKRWDAATEYADPRAEDGRPADQVIVAALGLRPRKRFLYLFDYGDELLHDVWLVRTAPAEARPKYPRIVEVHGESPPQYPLDDEA